MTVKLPLPPLIVPAEVVPSPQLIVAEYALAVALVFGSVIVATVPPTGVPAAPVNERPPAGTVSTITVFNENVCDCAGGEAVGRSNRCPSALSIVVARAARCSRTGSVDVPQGPASIVA